MYVGIILQAQVEMEPIKHENVSVTNALNFDQQHTHMLKHTHTHKHKHNNMNNGDSHTDPGTNKTYYINMANKYACIYHS